MQLNKNIFRAYDIRGIVSETLFPQDAYLIGKAFAEYTKEQLNKPSIKISLCRDGRISSPIMHQYLLAGLNSVVGVEVIDIGIGPSPLLYFSVCDEGFDGGVMITGSHNPKHHNGFKFMLGKNALFGEEILELGRRCNASNLGDIASQISPPLPINNELMHKDIHTNYINILLDSLSEGASKLNIIWDAGNGASGNILQELLPRLAGEHKLLYGEVDGNFPNHHPDPSKEENLQELIKQVKARGADAGIAFDGDADRIGAVDNGGNVIPPDVLIALFAEDVLSDVSYQGKPIIADVKAGQFLFDYIKQQGGQPLMWKTGHSFIKAKMKEVASPLGGEMSGHIFFADKYYGFDDGIYAGIRLLNIIAKLKAGGKTLANKLASFPKIFATPEIRQKVADEVKFEIVEDIKKQLIKEGIEFNDIDGVRVSDDVLEGFFLIRASNTAGELVMRAEAKTETGLKKLKDKMESLVEIG